MVDESTFFPKRVIVKKVRGKSKVNFFEKCLARGPPRLSTPMDGHQYGRKPRTKEPIPIAGKLTYRVRKRWDMDSYGR